MNVEPDGSPLRSIVYLPAWNAEAIAATRTVPCDAVILCMEDATPAERKPGARATVAATLAAGGFAARQVIVRVNGLDTAWGAEDLQALQGCRPDAILVPSIGTPNDLSRYRERTDAVLWVMIETPQAVLAVDAIAAGARAAGVSAFVLGTNDLARALGARPRPTREVFWPVFTQTLLAARAHGVAVYDGIFMDVSDEAGLRMQCEQAVQFGFDGKTLFHPRQVAICNEIFASVERKDQDSR